MATLITNAHLISPDCEIFDAAIEIAGDRISRVYRSGQTLPERGDIYDAGGRMAVPGFIDPHCHGAVGYEVTGDDPQGIFRIGEAKIQEGVTSYCPTTLTLSEEKLAESLHNIEAYRTAPTGCKVIGTHLEGPHINPNCIGAQNPAFLRKPDIAEVRRLNAISPVALITYAIEMEDDHEFTKGLAQLGIRGSCGHSEATYSQFKAAMPHGMGRLTHFCNQMTALHHREVGLVGTGFLEDEVMIEMICDKIHLCPDMIRVAFKIKPIETILLITDAMEAAGLPDGDYQLGGLAVKVSDGAARLASNGALAGSVLRLNEALRNVAEVTGRPLPEIIRTTSLNHANDLGLRDLGRLEENYIADITILNADFSVAAVFVDGQRKL